MPRLHGFDYKRPYFYMVTLKGGGEAPLRTHPFSAVSEDGRIVENAVTAAFERAIAAFPRQWPWVESFEPHVIMPDHLHLMVKLGGHGAPGGPPARPVHLGTLVGQLKKRLRAAYWEVVRPGLPAGIPPDVFDRDWHDWIVKKPGQLAAFRRYILENPARHARRRAHRRYFTQAREIDVGGSRFWAYGNEALLELPAIVAIQGHRRPREPAPDAPPGNTREALLTAAGRIGPGGAGMSTFLSALEKEAGNAIAKAGGSLILLAAQGFAPRWHPPEKQERLCAAGRLLCLTPYAPQTDRLPKQEMHIRAHDLAAWALSHSHAQLEAWPE